MTKLTFEYNGKIYEVYGRAQHINGYYQPHIYDTQLNTIPNNQMLILKRYLFSNGFSKEELEGKSTHELVYMTKKYLS